MKVSFKPTPQAPRKPKLKYRLGDNPVWHIDIPSHSNPSFFGPLLTPKTECLLAIVLHTKQKIIAST